MAQIEEIYSIKNSVKILLKQQRTGKFVMKYLLAGYNIWRANAN